MASSTGDSPARRAAAVAVASARMGGAVLRPALKPLGGGDRFRRLLKGTDQGVDLPDKELAPIAAPRWDTRQGPPNEQALALSEEDVENERVRENARKAFQLSMGTEAAALANAQRQEREAKAMAHDRTRARGTR